jgi:hypothetical protein
MPQFKAMSLLYGGQSWGSTYFFRDGLGTELGETEPGDKVIGTELRDSDGDRAEATKL